eukprot:12130293-Ditylum_brightwellii.AAC.1
MVALANGESSKDEEGKLFMDELMNLEFGMDNCCTNHIYRHRKLFKEMREAQEGMGILGIRGFKKPE